VGKYQVNQEKITQAYKMLKDSGIDLWMILTSEGSDPCLPLIPGVKTVGPGAFIFTSAGTSYALCSSIDAQDIEESKLFDEVIKYSSTGLGEPLKKLIENLEPKNIALNFSQDEHLCDGLTMGRYRWLLETLGKGYEKKFVSSEKILTRLRSIKSPEELRRIKEAVRITQEIYDTVLNQIEVGMSEIEIGQLFIDEMTQRDVVSAGSKALTPPIVMKERIAHRGPGEARLVPGDFLIMDFGVDYEGYVADIARTAYVLKEGEMEAPPYFQEVFQTAHGAITAAIDAIKPGAKGFEVDEVARNYILERNLPEITHATGHQVGRIPHDGGTLLGPRWDRYGKAPYGLIEEGMVFTVEPTIFVENGPAVLVEENIVVKTKGAELLSKRQDQLFLIGPKK